MALIWRFLTIFPSLVAKSFGLEPLRIHLLETLYLKDYVHELGLGFEDSGGLLLQRRFNDNVLCGKEGKAAEILHP